ncbi:MAG TPA: hypothetical protein VEX57_21210 [Microlunatus sp.]|nr:hypothetical protein [Microlunatus sp.]
MPGIVPLIPLHGIASRHDLPLPFGFVLIGAATALAISFVVLLLAWRSPRFVAEPGVRVPRIQAVVDRQGVRTVARLLVLALFAWVGLAVTIGPDRLTNPVFGFVFVWLWVGLVPLSLIMGPVWRVVNPLRTLHLGLCRLARTDPDHGLVRLPARLGVWPAALSLFGFAWLELVQPDRTTLNVIRLWVLAWLVIMIIGAVLGGRRWIGSADPFEVYATTVARLSPWRRSADGSLRFVNPLAGLNASELPVGSVGVLAVLLGSTAFDSFANLTWWIQTVQTSDASPVLWETGGLLTMIAIVLITFAAASAWVARYPDRDGGRLRPPEAVRAMAGSLVPIVVGYAIAHYATLLIVEGQRVLVNLSDPLGRGWNVFATADLAVSTAVFSHPTAVALIQLCAIVGGHLLGIVAAHERAVTLLEPRSALAGQWPMLVVMVGYTSAGLVLLFSP